LASTLDLFARLFAQLLFEVPQIKTLNTWDFDYTGRFI